MKGMLQQALSDQGRRLSDAEAGINQLQGRVSDKGKILAGHEERISDLESDNDSRIGKLTGIGALILASIGTGLAVINRFTL